MEAIGILHDELAATQQPEARTNLVAILRLNLIERGRKLPIGTQFVTHERSDELFVRGSKAKAVVMTVVHAHEFGAIIVPAARFEPEFSRLERWHEDLLSTRGIHLFAHDVLYLLQHAHAKRQECIDARSHLADHARAHEQFVRGDLGIGRIFLKRRNIEIAHIEDFAHNLLSYRLACSGIVYQVRDLVE